MSRDVIEITDSEDDAPTRAPASVPSRSLSRTVSLSAITDLCSSDDDAEPPPSSQPVFDWSPPDSSSPARGRAGGFFEDTEDEEDVKGKGKGKEKAPVTTSPKKRKSAEDDGTKAKKKRRTADDIKRDKEEKARAKEEAKHAKELEKAAKKAKQDANKLKLNKKEERRDMILHVPARLAALRPVLAALPHAMIDDGGKKFDIVEDAHGELIRWARKETATYDALAREWVPCEERIRFENACMLFTTVEEIASQRFDVLGRVREAKTGGQQVFLMIHGRRVDALEGILARVQIIHKCFIVHVEDAADAAARIVNITGDLAIRPYKIIHMTHLPFAPDLIKPCSRGEKDTYLHMLAQIPTVTPTIAKNIALQYPTFDKLLAALEGKQSAREQMGVFLGIPLGQKNGATLGADRARHLVDLLLADDPLVTIG